MASRRSLTYAASMWTSRPGISGAVKETSSRSFSRIVCSRRAPMFSIFSLASALMRAISSMASSWKRRRIFSVSSKATYWRISAFLGSVRMRTKSFLSSELSSTRIGNRPWNSGIRSDGLELWKAPDAMKRTWSVLTSPYFELTVEPSTMGRRSR